MDTNELYNPGSSKQERQYDTIIRTNIERACELVDGINQGLHNTDRTLEELRPELELVTEQAEQLEESLGITPSDHQELSGTVELSDLNLEAAPDIEFDMELG